MNLIQKQKAFSERLAKLILHLVAQGYEVTFGECWRPPETAAIYASQGKGISNSLHSQRLAVDLNLFKDGKLLIHTDEYHEAGSFWECLSTDDCVCSWGGDFGDGNHFSIEHNGIR